MGDLTNCSACGTLYIKNAVREVCNNCYKEEEMKFDTVYTFMRKRENRAATIETVVTHTGVSEELIHKWVRKKRLHSAQFPGLGYPCDKCGTIIREGKLCSTCIGSIRTDLAHVAKEEEYQAKLKANQKTYYTTDRNK
ncbi:TIGR03826 family flagellar region protein [Mangrovibacillus cuniculi]|uniref:Flagellar protein n=1 Tax=Mangrovibacillus cuniculi TaxID=2593652 RepID=A0A7S8CD05_9BACI|nr:TIGR03826 family flagellar region protein [Mangrovibacillus cuniculi]QPC47518.1 hypothetical protein G8O30_11445 [Mangrovibacillus cuniculi]